MDYFKVKGMKFDDFDDFDKFDKFDKLNSALVG
jgi:hypothetical protein